MAVSEMRLSVFDMFKIGIGPDMLTKYEETARGGLAVNIVEC